MTKMLKNKFLIKFKNKIFLTILILLTLVRPATSEAISFSFKDSFGTISGPNYNIVFKFIAMSGSIYVAYKVYTKFSISAICSGFFEFMDMPGKIEVLQKKVEDGNTKIMEQDVRLETIEKNTEQQAKTLESLKLSIDDHTRLLKIIVEEQKIFNTQCLGLSARLQSIEDLFSENKIQLSLIAASVSNFKSDLIKMEQSNGNLMIFIEKKFTDNNSKLEDLKKLFSDKELESTILQSLLKDLSEQVTSSDAANSNLIKEIMIDLRNTLDKHKLEVSSQNASIAEQLSSSNALLLLLRQQCDRLSDSLEKKMQSMSDARRLEAQEIKNQLADIQEKIPCILKQVLRIQGNDTFQPESSSSMMITAPQPTPIERRSIALQTVQLAQIATQTDFNGDTSNNDLKILIPRKTPRLRLVLLEELPKK